METFPKGAISEVFGSLSTGKSIIMCRKVALAAAAGEFCAVVDAQSSFDPLSARRAGMDLRRLLWVKAHQLGRALKAVDIIIHAGGFGVVMLDLCQVPAKDLNSIPISYWYRFRLAVEMKSTCLIVVADQSLVKSCARVQLEVKRRSLQWSGSVFEGIDFEVLARKGRSSSFESVPPLELEQAQLGLGSARFSLDQAQLGLDQASLRMAG